MSPVTTEIYSVKSLVGELRNLMESNYRQIAVEGEISGLARPASGHLYFSLKEENALIRCAFFRNRRLRSIDPEEGMQVIVHGQVSIYESRGDLQLIVSRLEAAGEGALQRAFLQLKQKLLSEGLFDPAHKKQLPLYPAVIGVITSTSGAVLHDILVTLKRRFPAARVIVYPALVQGAEATKSICDALTTATRHDQANVLIVARGGGSLEDLQAFNDENVARTIFSCPITVVSAVGHETDFTIADMVADHRAPTPTAAAELVTPDRLKLQIELRRDQKRLHDRAQRKIDTLRQSVDYATARLVHPTQKLARYKLENRNLRTTLRSAVVLAILRAGHRLDQLRSRTRAINPAARLALSRQQLSQGRNQLVRRMADCLARNGNQLDHLSAQLTLVSPHQTLERGYTILQDNRGKVVNRTEQVRHGQKLTATLVDGQLELQVESKI